MKLRNPFAGWEVIDYIGAMMITLITASLGMLVSGHPWYSLYLAAAALAPVTAIGFFFIIIAAMWGGDANSDY